MSVVAAKFRKAGIAALALMGVSAFDANAQSRDPGCNGGNCGTPTVINNGGTATATATAQGGAGGAGGAGGIGQGGAGGIGQGGTGQGGNAQGGNVDIRTPRQAPGIGAGMIGAAVDGCLAVVGLQLGITTPLGGLIGGNTRSDFNERCAEVLRENEYARHLVTMFMGSTDPRVRANYAASFIRVASETSANFRTAFTTVRARIAECGRPTGDEFTDTINWSGDRGEACYREALLGSTSLVAPRRAQQHQPQQRRPAAAPAQRAAAAPACPGVTVQVIVRGGQEVAQCRAPAQAPN